MGQTAVHFRWGQSNGHLSQTTARYDHPAAAILSAGNLQTLANEAQTQFNAMAADYCADLLLGRCAVQGYTRLAVPPPDPDDRRGYFSPTTVEVDATVAPVNGSAPGQSAAPQVAWVVSLRTATAGRRGRGRLYTPQPPEAEVQADGGVLDNVARLAAWSAALDALENVFAGVPQLELIVHSAKFDLVSVVTNKTADAGVDTQRNRLQ